MEEVDLDFEMYSFSKDVDKLDQQKLFHDIHYSTALNTCRELIGNLNSLLKTLENSKLSTAEYGKKVAVLALKTRFFSSISPSLTRVLEKLCEHGFKVTTGLGDTSSVANSSFSDCQKCGSSMDCCDCEAFRSAFSELLTILQKLDLLDRLILNVSIRTVNHALKNHVQQTATESMDYEKLPILSQWVKGDVMDWLSGVLQPRNNCERQDLEDRLLFSLHEAYGKALISQLFEMIVDYPDSAPVINDLKACIERVPLLPTLLESLKGIIGERVLHSGVNTPEILLVYIQSIKSLHLLDSSGVIVTIICDMIRQYLRQRSDTVRCIVSFLTEQKHVELNEDLMREGGPVSDEAGEGEEEEVVEATWKTWTPPKNNGLPEGIRGTGKSKDMISMMVGVYGSKEVFVKEYCQLLAERLVHNKDVDLANEEKYVELLKLRFGENELHQCEVMLKDMRDSKRIEDHVNSEENAENREFDVSVSILSSQYWPSSELREEKLAIPKNPFGRLEAYRKSYESLKSSRTLDYRWHLGSVSLELEVSGRATRFNVAPFLAAVISQFQVKESWSLRDLSKELQASQVAVRKRLSYWTMVGVLEETGGKRDIWNLAGSLPATEKSLAAFSADSTDEDEDDVDTSLTSESEEHELEIYWKYICNILRLGPLKPERLHALLKNMYSSPGKPSPSIAVVNAFLQSKVKDQLLIFVNGAYKLQTKPS